MMPAPLMSLAPGTRLGPYEILAPLGAGGMGEVYRATDTRLKRDVAIKVLPEAFASDLERLARFTREAQTLAALNHPNIAHIHGLEEVGSLRALVLELVEGDDLSTLIARGPMPLAEAVSIARQIADALDAAHEQGIIHRDLKPANVKVRADGTVKVLDFGLAKAMDPAGISSANVANSPTLTARATQMGMILGTAAYMAPEQAKGRAVDRRADIWAFGAVLYEMLTGQRAFKGDDISEVLASVLKTEPNWNELPAGTPPSVRRLLRRCLEKDRSKRLGAISDARLELDEAESTTTLADAPAAAPRASIGLGRAAALVAITMLTTLGVVRLISPSPPVSNVSGATHLSIGLPDSDEVTDTDYLPLAISPDGTRVTYVGWHDGVRRLFLRSLADTDPAPLAGTEGARSPFFSPDGQWIGFFAQGKLKKAAVASAAVQIISDNVADPRGGTWSPDDTIYFAPTNVSGIWKVPASGGTLSEVTRLDHTRGEISHRWPQALPDGKTLLFSSWTGPGPDERAIAVQSLVTGDRHVLVPGGDTARYLPAGYLTDGRLDTLLAVPWHPSQTELGNIAPISLPEFPRLENEGAADYAVSTNGTLAYVAGGASRYAQRVVWVDRAGTTEALPMPERDYEAVGLSPDGQRAVVQVREGTMGLWLYDFARHTLTPFATTGGSSQGAVWTPDSRRIIYRGTRKGTRNLYWKSADGSGDEERLTTKADVIQTPTSVSPDGQWLVFAEGGGNGGVWAMPLQGDRGVARPEPAEGRTPRQLVQAGVNGQISPAGRWLAYQSNVSGQTEVYAVPFPGPGPRIPISANGGDNPRWSRDGRELFYTRAATMMAVTVTPGATLSVSSPRVLFEGRYRPSPNALTAFDVSADGRRFLRVQQVQPDRPVTRIEVVLNWLAEFKSLGAAK